jgi:hypothetical protein
MRPPELRGQEGYSFFSLDPDRPDSLEMEYFDRGTVRDPRYLERVRELARYLWIQSAKLSNISLTVEPAPRSTGSRTVFLAKPAADMRQSYDRIVQELQNRGYSVAPPPAEDIPLDSSAKTYVDDALDRSEMAIHLVGEKLGYAPDDCEPVVTLQLNRSAYRAEADEQGRPGHPLPRRPFARIIWAPRFLQSDKDEDYGLERDPLGVLTRLGQQLPTDKIVGDSLSKLVDFLLQFLERSISPPELVGALSQTPRVYVYHGPLDADYALTVAQALQKAEIEPVLPVLEGDPAEITAFHRQILMEVEVVVLCWAASSEVWMRAHSRELGDWRRLGRTDRFARRGLIAGPPPGARKQVYLKIPPRTEIDVVVDLTESEQMTTDLIGSIIPR